MLSGMCEICTYHFFEIGTKVFKKRCVGTIRKMLKIKGCELTASVFKENSIDGKVDEKESYIIDLQPYYLKKKVFTFVAELFETMETRSRSKNFACF